ncbi:TetR/AcrR family transcriptional regulator [Alicyclobacillus sendaiensis]|uniref:TetR/AcrR family transcriptional regulator n=1 Tax=Alicyclobacillus sendaiensis TaxID=192387 RepID=UPI0007849314|nr:TetR/AcrR family transcriptional regulator [Alicyclobacillus sendaiensis]
MTSGLAEKRREKYEAILQAALKVFAEHGFFNSQVSKIAREAGVADGTIYLYFKNKEDILISLFREKLGSLVRKFHEHVHEDDRADEAIRKICELHFTELEKDVHLAKVTQLELRQSSRELHSEISKALKPYIQLIEDVLVRGIEQGIFRRDLDVKLTRLLIFGAMDEVVSSWLISGRRYSLSAQVDKTVDFFLRGLRA